MRMMLLPIDKGRPVSLEKAVVLFGRGTDCDVVLAFSKKVSRKHCCIAQINNHFLIRDLGSLNGIRVNNEPVKTESLIEPGDQILIGDVGFRFVPFDAAAFKAAAAAPKTENAPPEKPADQDKKPPSPPKPMDRHLLSQDIPVAIPDEGEDFRVEESIPLKALGQIPDSEIMEVVPEDIVNEDSEVIDIDEDDIVH